ncbi:MAG: hypothetical protein ACHQWU_16900, partial [Gemmatimonadales bacterium]
MTEQPDDPATASTEPPETCGAARTTPDGRALECRRPFNHDEDHFDDVAGLGWLNLAHDTAGLTQE